MASKKSSAVVAANKKARAKRVAFTEGGKWQDYVSKKYGWLVNIYNSNPEVAQLIKDSYVNDWSEQEYTDAITNSKWFVNLQVGEYDYLKGTFKNDRAYLDKVDQAVSTVKSVAANQGYALTDEQSRLLAAGVLKGGWNNQKISEEVGKTVVAGAKQGQQVTAEIPSAETPTKLQTGSDAASVRSLARSYGLNLSDSSVEGYVQSLVSKSMSEEQLVTQFREQAKALYPAVAKQLDAGDLNTATASYRSIAANVLGVNESAVDLSDATKYGKLLTYHDPKTNEARLMNATEWTQYLRGLPEWSNTKEAKDQYQAMIDTVNNLFGKVR
jgi:uncharacterized protein (DUF697 family)